MLSAKLRASQSQRKNPPSKAYQKRYFSKRDTVKYATDHDDRSMPASTKPSQHKPTNPSPNPSRKTQSKTPQIQPTKTRHTPPSQPRSQPKQHPAATPPTYPFPAYNIVKEPITATCR
jgi:hypothetical protein